MADRLKRDLPTNALIARVDGNEFTAASPGVDDPTEALRLTGELSAILAAPMKVKGHDVLVTAISGISVFPHDAQDAALLLDRAHAAAYRTKACVRQPRSTTSRSPRDSSFPSDASFCSRPAATRKKRASNPASASASP